MSWILSSSQDVNRSKCLHLLAFLLWTSKIWVNLAFYVPLTLITKFILWFAKHKNNTNKIPWTKSFPLAVAEQFYTTWCMCLTTRLFYLTGFSLYIQQKKKDSWVSSVPCNRFDTLPPCSRCCSLTVSEISSAHVNTNELLGLVCESCGSILNPLVTRVSKTVAAPQLNKNTRSIKKPERWTKVYNRGRHV